MRTEHTYDTEGVRTKTVVAPGTPDAEETRYAYDAQRRLERIEVEAGSGTGDDLVTTYDIDAAGRITRVHAPGGRETAYGYDAFGRLRLTRAAPDTPDESTAQAAYDLAGNLVSVTNPNGHTTSYTYDKRGLVTAVASPNGSGGTRTMSLAYDANGNLTSRTDPRGRLTTYAYDNADQLTAVDYAEVGESDVGYTYDARGLVTQVTDAAGTHTYAYDHRGQLTSETNGADTISRTFTAAGRPLGLTLPGGKDIAYGYDAAGRLDTITDWASRDVAYGYDDAGRLASETRPVSGMGSTWAYDAAGRTQEITHTGAGGALAGRFTYTYGAAGNVASIADEDGDISGFGYDQLNRLTSEAYADPAMSRTYTYDPAGNRLTKTESGQTTSYAYDAAGQLTATSGAEVASFGYDAAGNMVSRTQDADTTTYSYDTNNRLVAVDNPAGQDDATYVYDAEDRRVQETVGGVSGSFLFDGSQVARETRAGAATFYVRGPPGLVLSEDGSGQPTYYVHDALGSVSGLLGATGALTDEYRTTAFGEARTHTGTHAQPYGYVGNKRLAGAPGLDDFHARAYDAALGRFTAVDPITGRPDLPQSLNPYGYGGGSPFAQPRAIGSAGRGAGRGAARAAERWENAKGPDGVVRDPLTGKEIKKDEPWDLGHKPGYEHYKHAESARRRGLTREEFLNEYNNPDHYHPELPSSNRGHRNEADRQTYYGP